MMKSICVFGDSTAWGAWDMELGGWVNRLWLETAHRSGDEMCEVYNLSISGGTSRTILERFEAEARIREADALIFQTGGNDAYLTSRNGLNQIPLQEFEVNIQRMIERAKKITTNIICMGFKNVDESRTAPVFWKEIYYLNSEIKKYNERMKDICRKNDVLYLDIFGLLNNEDLEDGLHPNQNGHEKIFAKVKEFLVKERWI
jgi:lysophospholipase L1-like esterase